MLRILQVPHWYPPHHGGVEYHTSSLSRWLAARGHEVTVLTTAYPGVPKEYTEGGVRVIRARVLASPLRNPISLELVWKLRRMAGNFDIIHFHGPYAFHSFLGLRIIKRPKVVTVHGRPYYEGFGRVVMGIYEPLVISSMRKAERVIVLTEQDLQFYGSKLEGVVMIPNFVDVEEVRDSVSADNKTPSFEEIKLVYVGALNEGKGILPLVRILSKYPHVRLEVIGDGPLKGRILREKGENINLIGEMRREEVWRAMASSHALILPSRREGLPTVVLEALSLGKPALLSDIPPHRIAFGDSALYFRLEDPSSLERALKELVRDYDSLSERGRALVEEKYDIGVVAPKILSLYEEVAEAYRDE